MLHLYVLISRNKLRSNSVCIGDLSCSLHQFSYKYQRLILKDNSLTTVDALNQEAPCLSIYIWSVGGGH
jgi:hypothetical protein